MTVYIIVYIIVNSLCSYTKRKHTTPRREQCVFSRIKERVRNNQKDEWSPSRNTNSVRITTLAHRGFLEKRKRRIDYVSMDIIP